jgi:hypothetical protein
VLLPVLLALGRFRCLELGVQERHGCASVGFVLCTRHALDCILRVCTVSLSVTRDAAALGRATADSLHAIAAY